MTQTDPLPDQLREMREKGLSTREMARVLHLSQTTVSRRLRELDLKRKQTLMVIMYGVLTISAVVLAAAVATIAWGLPAPEPARAQRRTGSGTALNRVAPALQATLSRVAPFIVA